MPVELSSVTSLWRSFSCGASI